MLKSASLFDEAKNHAADFGVKVSGVELDFPGVVKFRDKVVLQGAKGVEYLMKKHKIDVHAGLGRLVSPHEVAVTGDAGETRLDTKNVLLATGSVPARPAVPEGGRRERPELGPHPEVAVDPEVAPRDRLGRRRRGVRVLLLALRHEDRPRRGPARASCPWRTRRSRRRSSASSGSAASRCARRRASSPWRRTGTGRSRSNAKRPDGGPLSWDVEKVLLAVGRRPVSEGLGLEAAGRRDGPRLREGGREPAHERAGRVGDRRRHARRSGSRTSPPPKESSPPRRWPAIRPCR